jgi:myosin heavy subunit
VCLLTTHVIQFFLIHFRLDSIYRILSGILLLGNIEFTGGEKAVIKDDAALDELVDLWSLLKGLTKV